MVGNLVVNGILLLVLYGLYSWTPWASLVVALLSSFAFAQVLIFDKEFVDQIASQGGDYVSLLLGAGISLAGVIVSIMRLMDKTPWLKPSTTINNLWFSWQVCYIVLGMKKIFPFASLFFAFNSLLAQESVYYDSTGWT